MRTETISEKISYIASSTNPLSADIGIIKAADGIWLFDVGNGSENVKDLTDSYNVVLSHFHPDHCGNIERIKKNALYVSKTTYAHVHEGTILSETTRFGDVCVFPIPSNHAKGCLGLEVDEKYAFIGDALCGKVKEDEMIYNPQIVQAQIALLKSLKADCLLVSHFPGLLREKSEVLNELAEIYRELRRA